VLAFLPTSYFPAENTRCQNRSVSYTNTLPVMQNSKIYGKNN